MAFSDSFWVRLIAGRVLARLVLGDRLFQVLQAEWQLLGRQLLGPAAELVAHQTLDQQPQLVVLGFDLAALVQHRAQHLLKHYGIVRHGIGVNLHRRIMINPAAPGPAI